ncbi:MAG: hypothetical protein ACKO0X_05530 [Bacteroidota bacterium]
MAIQTVMAAIRVAMGLPGSRSKKTMMQIAAKGPAKTLNRDIMR